MPKSLTPELWKPGSKRSITDEEARELLNSVFAGEPKNGDLNWLNQLLMSENEDMSACIYRGIAGISVSDPARAIKAFRSVHHLRNCCKIIIESVQYVQSFSQEFLQFLFEVLQSAPMSLHVSPLTPTPSPPIDWEDTAYSLKKNTKTSTIWDPPNIEPVCLSCTPLSSISDQPFFNCYTCGIVDDLKICLACALKCHKGHNVVFCGTQPFECSCASKPGACQYQTEVHLHDLYDLDRNSASDLLYNGGNPSETLDSHLINIRGERLTTARRPRTFRRENYSPPAEEEIEEQAEQREESQLRVEPQIPPSTFSSVNLFLSLAKANLKEASQSVDLRAIDFSSIRPKIVQTSFHFSSKKPFSSLCDFSVIQNAFQRQNRGSNRMHAYFQFSSFKACTLAFHDRSIIVIAEGANLKTYKTSDFSSLKTLSLDSPILTIEVCPMDPSVFAAASATEVYIISLDELGELQVTSKIEVAIGTSLILKVIWIPQKLMHLAVVSSLFVKVFDVPADCISPLICLMPEEGESITSAIFFGKESNIYCFSTTVSGKLYLQKCSDGPSNLGAELNIGIPKAPHCISFDEENELIFISSKPNLLSILRVHQLFEPTTISSFPLEGVNSLITFLFYNKGFHFFAVNSSNSLLYFELGHEVKYSLMLKCSPNSAVPLMERALLSLGYFTTEEGILSLSRKGDLLLLTQGGNQQISLPIFRCESKESSETFNVPPSFWSKSQTLNSFELFDGNQPIQKGRTIIIQKDSSLTLRQLKTSQIIVGVIFSFIDQTPKSISIFGRKYSLESQSRVGIPFRRDEVGFWKTLTFSFESTEKVTISRLEVHCIDSETMSIPMPIDISSQKWIDHSFSLLDFPDEFSQTSPSLFEAVELLLSYAAESEEVPTDVLVSLFDLMYRNEKLFSNCRRILLKIRPKVQNFFERWAEAISTFPPTSVTLHDFSLLPQSARKPFEATTFNSQKFNLYSLSFAFRGQ